MLEIIYSHPFWTTLWLWIIFISISNMRLIYIQNHISDPDEDYLD